MSIRFSIANSQQILFTISLIKTRRDPLTERVFQMEARGFEPLSEDIVHKLRFAMSVVTDLMSPEYRPMK
jgi:hypothetical protein